MELAPHGSHANVPAGTLVRPDRVTCLAGGARLAEPRTAGLPQDLLGDGEWATVAAQDGPAAAFVAPVGAAALLKGPVRWIAPRARVIALSADARASDSAALAQGSALLEAAAPREFSVLPNATLRVRESALLAATCVPSTDSEDPAWRVLRGACRAWVDPAARAPPEQSSAQSEEVPPEEDYREVSYEDDDDDDDEDDV